MNKKNEKTPLDVLKDARALIAPEGKWLQGWLSNTAEGEEVYPNNPAAVCFCAVGAISRACGGEHHSGPGRAAWQLLAKDEALTGFSGVADYNDAPNRTQAEMVALFDRTISGIEEAAGLAPQCSPA